MCGLIGFFLKNTQGRKNYQEKRSFIDQGLYMSALRGWDATGISVIRNPGHYPLVFKKAMASCDFVFLKKTQKILDDIDDAQAVLGHTRSATLKGHSQDQNAHPFQFDHITLTHNGHVTNWKGLGADCDIEVDSAHVAAAMAQKGELETLRRIQGDYALVWHNTKDKTINFARNHGRPLFYAHVPEWEGIAYASEYEMLGTLLSRNRIGIKDKFWAPQEHVHFKFNLEKGDLEKTSVPFLQTIDRAREGPSTATPAGGGIGREISGSPTIRPLPKTTDLGGTTFLQDNKELVAAVEKSNAGRKSKHANSGRPGSVRGVDKAKDKLRVLGLKYDQVIGCDPRKFVHYRDGNKLGMAVAALAGSKHRGLVGEIQNITKDIYDVISEHGRYVLARCVNVKTYGDKQVAVLELDGAFLDKAILEYKEEVELSKQDANGNMLSYAGPGGRLVSRDRFLQLTRHGCAYCESVIDPRFAELVFWIDNSPICHKCADDEDVNLLLGLQAARMQ